ncbi:type IV pilin N-terminal domain-containing protein [Thermoplasmatota archaeon]
MKSRVLFIKFKNNNAVTDLVGTMLMLFIAIALFSIIYFFVFSVEAPVRAPSTNILGYLEGDNIYFEHWGGETLGTEASIIFTIAGDRKDSVYLQDDFEIWDSKGENIANPDKWSFGEILFFNASDIFSEQLINKRVTYSFISELGGSIISEGMLQDGIISTSGNNPPDEPDNPDPWDGETISNEQDITLRVTVADPDGDNMNVKFYNASNDNLIGEDPNVLSGSTASVIWTGLGDTTYSWYVNATDGIAWNISDTWSFTITTINLPTITITNPNGGETWQAGTTEIITWSTSSGDGAIQNISLSYSTNNGGDWNTISLDTDDDGLYSWLLPDEPSVNCLIRGIVYDDTPSSNNDVSDSVFEIISAPPGAPTIDSVEHTGYGISTIEDTSSSFTAIEGNEIANDHAATHTQDNTHHSVSEIDTDKDDFNLTILYSIDITGDVGPYNLNIDAYKTLTGGDASRFYVYYRNTIGYYQLGEITQTSQSDTYQTFPLSDINLGDTIDIYIVNDTTDNKISTVHVDHLYIESSGTIPGLDNTINWTRSNDDGTGDDDVDYYNVNRSPNIGGPWTTIDTVNAIDAASYSYEDVNAGTADSQIWYYQIIAVDDYGQEGSSNIMSEP